MCKSILFSCVSTAESFDTVLNHYKAILKIRLIRNDLPWRKKSQQVMLKSCIKWKALFLFTLTYICFIQIKHYKHLKTNVKIKEVT